MREEYLSSDLIRQNLKTRMIGKKVLYLLSTRSTNEVAKDEAVRGAPEGMIVVAGRQTQGRGRLKRSWMTPEGNIALSVILYPDFPHLNSLVMMASLAVVHAVEKVTGLAAAIKWPNDVLINGRKVCGILVESDISKEKVNYTVTGIGINVNIGQDELTDVHTPATSLSIEAGQDISRLEMIRELLREMDGMYRDVKTGGSVFDEWRDRLVTLGTEVQVTSVNEVIVGLAEAVDPDGNLLVRDPEGAIHKVVAGDVTLRR